MVVWHGGSCKEVCGTILRVGKQEYTTTLQSIYSMHRWPPLQRRRNKICWRIVKYILPNCSEMLILSTRRSSKKPLRMRVRSWKHQLLLLCFVKLLRKIVGVVDPTKLRQNLRVFWKLMNLRECVWENHYRLITKTILQEKVRIHCSITNWCTNLFLCREPWKFPQQKQQWTRNGKNWRKFRRGIRSKKEVIDEGRTKGAKVHFASLMDICHLKNAELGAKHQKYKGRVVLRGDIVKDDSGSHAVFTEQGSASQTTATKVMDIISRLPGCAGQAADAVSAYTQVKMEDAPTLLPIPQSECPDIWIRLPQNKWPKSWSSMEDPVVPLERNLYGHPLAKTIMGKAIRESSVEIRYGWEKVPWECLFVNRE